MSKFFTLYKIEFKLNLREMSGVLFGVIIPVLLMVILGFIYGDKTIDDESTITLVQQGLPGIMSIGICASGLMGLPLAVAAYRDKRILRRFQVTPTSPLLLLFVQFAIQATLAIISSLVIYLIATLFFGYTMIGNPFSFIGIYTLLLLSIFSIGMLIASVAKNVNTASIWAMALYFPMFLLSGATIPFEILPKFLQNVSKVFPLTQGIIILKEVSLNQTPDINVLILIGLALLGMISIALSRKFFKYDY